jgi:hypothetical protein
MNEARRLNNLSLILCLANHYAVPSNCLFLLKPSIYDHLSNRTACKAKGIADMLVFHKVSSQMNIVHPDEN